MNKEVEEFKQSISDEFFIFIDDQQSEDFWNKSLKSKLFEKEGYDVKWLSGAESRLQGHLGRVFKI